MPAAKIALLTFFPRFLWSVALDRLHSVEFGD